MAVEPTDFSAPGTGFQIEGSHRIPVTDTTVTAFIGRAQRGPLNVPVVIESFEGYRRIFGGHSPLSFLSHSVQQYFQHGGHRAAVVRVANRAIRALLELQADGEVLRLQAREPGGHEFLRASVDYDSVGDDTRRFNLVVQRLTRPGCQLVEDQELFSSLSMDEMDNRFIVDVLRDSELVRLSGPLPHGRPDATRPRRPGEPIPYIEMSSAGSDGEEITDYDIIGSNEEATGLFALEAVEEIHLLCIPSLSSGREIGITTFLAAERYCRRRQAMLIWDPPWSWRSAEMALIGIRNSNLASRNAMTYFPRVYSREVGERYPEGLPACGAVAGMLSQSDQRGDWRPLQKDESRLKSGLLPVVEVGPRQVSMLQQQGINAIIRTDSGAAAFQGDVSLAGCSAVSRLWQRLDRRRLAFFILGSVRRRTRWALGECGSPDAMQALAHELNAFLHELFERGALAGDRPAQAYFVKIVPAPDDDEVARLVIRLGVALEKPSAFQIYDIVHRPEGSTCRAVPPVEAAQLAG